MSVVLIASASRLSCSTDGATAPRDGDPRHDPDSRPRSPRRIPSPGVPFQAGIATGEGEPCSGALVFCRGPDDVEAWAGKAIAAGGEDGLVWFAFPKGEAGRAAGIGRDAGWAALERLGWRGVRVISLDEDWTAKRCREASKVKAG